MRKKWMIYGTLIVFSLFFSINLYLFDKYGKSLSRTFISDSIIQVKQRDFTLFFPAKGVVSSPHIEKIFLPTDMNEVEKIFVRRGQEVQMGTPLFSLKSNQLDEQIEELANELAFWQQQQNEVEQSIDSLKMDMETQEGQENSQALLIQQLQSEKREIESKIHHLTNQKAYLEKKKEKQIVKSPAAGIIDNVELNKPHPFISIVSRPYLIKGTLSEMELPKIKEGQRVKIIPLGQRKNIYSGTITEIDKIPTQQKKESFYPFYVHLENNEASLPYGSHVSLSIILQESKDVPSIPKTSIVQKRKKHIVYKLSKDKVDARSVQLGLADGLEREIVSGIHAGDWIIDNPPSSLYEGMTISTPMELGKIKKEYFRYFSKTDMASLITSGFFRTKTDDVIEKMMKK
ncbi:efflux RND transporter periplasmic adaptor subunit [Parageobacillus toebii]|uniref:efflux RND transporter periplasmic adaptor subunit n=1 Tax=Parageobacillus toebii TaxID=153151 RepID=UPI002814FD3E|nr:efflux RND transporter periplasmic adaptor subunit [Parageobacillus toebii]WMT19826.1 efflux RND transporter periplasmic adaptor subunit [Parageobacillus toebii]